MTKCLFITGTDTGIGKTISSCIILNNLVNCGYKAIGYKPIATGCCKFNNMSCNLDVLHLINSSNVSLEYSEINPFLFKKATSPNIASFYENNYVNIEFLSYKLHKLKHLADYIIIEGAGGWFTPINNNVLYSDWVIKEKLTVILIVGIKIGCINHAILTSLAIQQNKELKLLGWIANNILENMNYKEEYINTLKKFLPIPMLGEIPYFKEFNIKLLSKYVKISLLNYI